MFLITSSFFIGSGYGIWKMDLLITLKVYSLFHSSFFFSTSGLFLNEFLVAGAKQPNYLVTADDVETYLAIEVQPLDDRKRKV